MALDYQNITDYRLGVGPTAPAAGDDLAVLATWQGYTWTEVKFVTGISLSDGGRTKDVTDLGSGQYGKSVREMLGVSLNLSVEHVLDDIDDSLDPGQEILAAASRTTGLASRVVVQLRHPGAVNSTNGTDFTANPADGKGTFMVATVQDGTHGLGSGGSGGSFVVASYSLVSFGTVRTLDFA